MTDLVNILCMSENVIPYLLSPKPHHTPNPWPVTLEQPRQPHGLPSAPRPAREWQCGGVPLQPQAPSLASLVKDIFSRNLIW